MRKTRPRKLYDFSRDNDANHMIDALPIRRRVVKTREINHQMPTLIAYSDLRQSICARRDLSV